ncbi:uncharacterized protein LOC141914815 isoform X2 [Tubulanus polymorphus]|uniref:uncharacterized protein LOC141914815 isoform X2 n=1 Tax=Tubulanus polymorphus TaxID=672921 RepID=UPI003DA22139
MGITGLLPFLKNASQGSNISDFKGCTVGVDTYCWLHKGAFACADKLGRGEPTDQRRSQYKKKAAQYLREGKRAEARDCFTKCIDVTPEMALETMQALRDLGVDCIVAPYEADAQLAYLNKIGFIDLIITEDSDLLLFGCNKVLFKLDINGNGTLIEKERLNEVTKLTFFTFDKFRYMCILSGCDYLASLYGVGLGKACKFFKMTRHTEPEKFLKKLPTYLNLNTKMTDEYIEGFRQANNTFLYQLVFDPKLRKLLPLNPYPPEVTPELLTYAGPMMSQQKALQLALGNINVNTGQQMASYNPDSYKAKPKNPSKFSRSRYSDDKRVPKWSIWGKTGRPQVGCPRTDQPHSKHFLQSTKGKEISVKFSVKRARPGIDSEDVKSNDELADLYNDESTEPNEKRAKYDKCFNSLDEPEIDHPVREDSIDYTAGNIQLSDDEEEDGQTFEKSLSKERDSFCEALEEACSPSKQVPNLETTPESKLRNCFAVSSLTKKRFNIMKPDAEDIPQVRSRFFIGKSFSKTSPSKLAKQTKISKNPFACAKLKMNTATQNGPKSGDIFQSELNELDMEKSDENSVPLARDDSEKLSRSCEKSNSLSVFAWSKSKVFKMSKMSSKCDNNELSDYPIDSSMNQDSLESLANRDLVDTSMSLDSAEDEDTKLRCSLSQQVSSPKVKMSCVGSQNNRTPLFRKRNESILDLIAKQKSKQKSVPDLIDLCDNSSCDTFDASGTTSAESSDTKLSDSPSLPDFSKCSEETEFKEQIKSHLGVKNPFSSHTNNIKQKSIQTGLGKCRSTGLSKNKSLKKATNTKAETMKQQGITCFLSQFKCEKNVDKLQSFGKRSTSSPTRRSPLSPSKFNTLETPTRNLDEYADIHRRIVLID